jgi:hypothetical protein
MASDFDEALRNFLLRNDLTLAIDVGATRTSLTAGQLTEAPIFSAQLLRVEDIDPGDEFAVKAELIAESEGDSLDEAINRLVDAYERYERESARRVDYNNNPDRQDDLMRPAFKVGETRSIDAHGKTLDVKLVSRGNYFLRVRGQQRGRWASTIAEVAEDAGSFVETGALPGAAMAFNR